MVITKNKSMRYAVLAIVIYSLGVAAIVTVHLVLSRTYLLDVSTSISRYVGMKVWSAVLYIFLCAVVCFFLAKFLQCGRKPLLYRVFGFVVIASLMSVAIFTHGAFGEFSTNMHYYLSRVIFISMMAHTLSGVICFPKTKRFLIPNLIVLVIDTALLFIAIFSFRTFMAYAFLSEFILIYSYFASMLTVCKEAGEQA